MITGTLASASNRADWIVGISAVDDTTGDPFDWTAATAIVVSVNDIDTAAVIMTGSLADGKITHGAAGSITWRFTTEAMATLNPGTYGVGLAYKKAGIVYTEFIGSLPVIEGYAAIP